MTTPTKTTSIKEYAKQVLVLAAFSLIGSAYLGVCMNVFLTFAGF